jgi:DNA-binding FrmR family transcriptional regulator
LQRLKKIKGQVEGIENMILDGRYCPDILVQVKAVTSALRSVELTILERHIRHCLAAAVESGSKKDAEKKIEEVLLVLSRKG